MNVFENIDVSETFTFLKMLTFFKRFRWGFHVFMLVNYKNALKMRFSLKDITRKLPNYLIKVINLNMYGPFFIVVQVNVWGIFKISKIG